MHMNMVCKENIAKLHFVARHPHSQLFKSKLATLRASCDDFTITER